MARPAGAERHNSNTMRRPFVLGVDDEHGAADLRLGLEAASARHSLCYNDSLTLAGIPEEAFEYRLGHRSALEWVIDQYQRKETSNPNRADDPEYIVRLVGQVIAVSLETVAITRALPEFAVQSG